MTGGLTEAQRLARALDLLEHRIDPDIERSFATLEERILAQALENVELAERRLREIQDLMDEDALIPSR